MQAQSMKTKSSEPIRCTWPSNPLSIRYHDEEWGVPQHDDRVLFEFLILEGAQAGLSWDTILKKRENYRAAFDGFNPERIARYDRRKMRACCAIPASFATGSRSHPRSEMPRHFLAVQKEFGSFDSYIWQFTGGKPLRKYLAPGRAGSGNAPLNPTP